MRSGRVIPSVCAVLLSGALAACSGGGGDDGAGVVAGFYPLQFVAERVTGEAVANLTPAGAEPHDLELSARDTTTLHDAALVVYLADFTPALDAVVRDLAADRVFDVATAARLTEHDDHDDDERGHDDDDHDDEHGHDDDDHDDDRDHAHEGADPHFWLDPQRLAGVATALAERLAADDPDGAAAYRQRAAALAGELDALDAEFAAGLADCEVTSLVTSHTAFGYLAARYGFTQVGIAGLSPDIEPAPGKLAEVTDFVNDHGVTTIYYETLVDPGVAETVAAEAGVSTAVLDPLEGLTAASDGADYFSVMRANLETLREGQRCR
ncbi:MAG TPA: metal ABC transporter substrate-binding protein [Ilumatobacter sp.]|nr:metal ABC transporter substrate-binding protein [Ilumatobacter sp.]